jgi:predicted RNA binding protein YcfA (HicA-like mRNA interferase family)
VCILSARGQPGVLRALKSDGWEEVAQKGSHVQLKHPSKPGRVTVPHPKRDLPIGTLKSIEKQAGIKLR